MKMNFKQIRWHCKDHRSRRAKIQVRKLIMHVNSSVYRLSATMTQVFRVDLYESDR